jgi:hypothetical protein
MNNQKKKDEIVRTLENGDVSSACHLLFSLPPYEIYSLLNKKFTDKYVLHILYGAFIPDQHIKVFKPFIDEIVLDHYLQKCIEPIHEFEAFLVADYPELLINAIRVNRSFMDDKVYDRLTGFAWDEKQRPHLLIWKEFRAIESALWENAEKYRTKYHEETLEEQFVALTLWVEE